MEDLTDEFRQRFEDFYRSFDQHLSRQTEYNEFLNSFSEDLEKLSRIPILPGLMSDASQGFHGFDDIYDENKSFSAADSTERPTSRISRSRSNSERQDTEEPSNVDMEISEQQKHRGSTLLNWISANENQVTLQTMAESCMKGLQKIDQDIITQLRGNVQNIISSATLVRTTDLFWFGLVFHFILFLRTIGRHEGGQRFKVATRGPGSADV